MATDVWKPEQYERFREERAQPFRDLLTLVRPAAGMRVLDVGCGTGELTAGMHRSLDAKRTLGIDRSAAMLTEARKHENGGLRFEQRDVTDFQPDQPFDLVFSNAALHWVDDHRELLATLRDWIAQDGQLAVQVPANHDAPAHLVAEELAQEAPFREALRGYVRRSPVLTPDAYSALLEELGFGERVAQLRVYTHQLESRDGVVEWVRGTLLTAYEERLGPELYTAFLERYRELLLPQLEDRRPYVYPFKRVLFRGRRTT